MTGGRSRSIGAVVTAPLGALANLLDVPMRLWQRLTGKGGMIAFFLLPNMLVFTLFVIVPLGINIVYSMTGGTELFLPARSYVGGDNFDRLLSCTDHTTPATCRAGWNAATPATPAARCWPPPSWAPATPRWACAPPTCN